MKDKVDFFVIGAPKCGTDSLRDFLAGSPSVFMSGPAEPNFFCADISAPDIDESEYFQHHYGKAPEGRILGEKSTWYLISEVAPAAVLKHNPDARFVAVIRDYPNMFRSLFLQLGTHGLEPEENLEAAWAASEKRTMIPGSRDRIFLDYRRACAVGAQLSNWARHVGPEQLLIVTFDDLVRNSDARLEICRFFGIEPPADLELPHANASLGRRNWLGRVLTPSPDLERTAQMLKRKLGIRSLGIGSGLRSLRSTVGMKNLEIQGIDPALGREIEEYFRADSVLVREMLRLFGLRAEGRYRAMKNGEDQA